MILRSLGIAILIGCPLAAGTIGFSVTGVTSAAFTDAQGYFGGGTIAGGTAFSLDFGYDPAGCSPLASPAAPFELLNACGAGAIQADFSINSTTISVISSGPSSLIEQSVNGGETYFQYIDPGSLNGLQYFLFSTDSYQAGLISSGPISNIDASAANEAYVCGPLLAPCDAIFLSVQSETPSLTPEPASMALFGIGAAVMCLGIRRRSRV